MPSMFSMWLITDAEYYLQLAREKAVSRWDCGSAKVRSRLSCESGKNNRTTGLAARLDELAGDGRQDSAQKSEPQAMISEPAENRSTRDRR